MSKSTIHPSLDSLVDLACRDGVDIRPTLLRVVTDLYVQKPGHNAAEETQYVELALGLIQAVDQPTRAIVATTLSAYPDAPAAVLALLAEFPQALAVEKPQTQSAIQPPAKPAPKPAPKPEATNELLEEFFAAGSDERRLILTNFDVATEGEARRLPPASAETLRRLENAALQCNSAEFARVLERALGIGHALSGRIAGDENGEPIVIAARALGMSASVLQRVLLFLNPAIGQSVERVYDLARLYDDLTPAAAERMLAIWRQPHTAAKPQHASIHWDDERRDVRSLSTPARYRSDRRRIEQPTRVRSNER
jgi:uncharacterized protein (DUF2336 family)